MPSPPRSPAAFPATRPRRLRAQAWARALVAETTLRPADLVWPVVVASGEAFEPVAAMPGIERVPVRALPALAEEAARLGIPALALFPNTPRELRTPGGEEALNPDALICRAVRAVKAAVPEIGVMCDVALDPYTSHGHDGLMGPDGTILNDETVEVLCAQALVQVEAGCDVIAPSDMMDGRVGAIRAALEAAGHTQTLILSYAAKYASGFYGPYREAVGSGGLLKGDKRTYQMDPANRAEALREVALDIAEGADMVMVKPGLPYLDIIREVKDAFGVPTLAFNVSGEYAMIEFAARAGALDRERVMLESLMAFRRAGADAILTYFAPDAARALKG
ncbi:MAG: porphobilinogen synthase [Alphaproteobacteria bacterium]|nr:porphobilinogen synthase [Alphaproteobacteria bacterium]